MLSLLTCFVGLLLYYEYLSFVLNELLSLIVWIMVD
jgi:hypothetical protein